MKYRYHFNYVIILFLFLVFSGQQAFSQRDSTKKSKATLEIGLGLHQVEGGFRTYSKAGYSFTFGLRIKFSQKFSLGITGESLKLVIERQNLNGIHTFNLAHFYVHGRYLLYSKGVLIPFIGAGSGIAMYREPNFNVPDMFFGDRLVQGESSRALGYFIETGVYLRNNYVLIYRHCLVGKTADPATFLAKQPINKIYTHYISIHIRI